MITTIESNCFDDGLMMEAYHGEKIWGKIKPHFVDWDLIPQCQRVQTRTEHLRSLRTDQRSSEREYTWGFYTERDTCVFLSCDK